MNMNSNSKEEDGDNAEENDAVNENRDSAGAHVAKFHHPGLRRSLEQKPRRQEDEHHDGHNDRTPVGTHLSLSLPLSPLSLPLSLEDIKERGEGSLEEMKREREREREEPEEKEAR